MSECPLIRQAVHNRETDHDLWFPHGVLHMKGTCEFHDFYRGGIQSLMAGTFLHGNFRQMAVGSNDGFQDDFPFLAVQAG